MVSQVRPAVRTLTSPLGRCSPCTPEEFKFESHQHIQRDTLQRKKTLVQSQYQVSMHKKMRLCCVPIIKRNKSNARFFKRKMNSNKILTFLKIHPLKSTSPVAGPLMPSPSKDVVFFFKDMANLPRGYLQCVLTIFALSARNAPQKVLDYRSLFDDRNFLC